jgi:hypothetical protein
MGTFSSYVRAQVVKLVTKQTALGLEVAAAALESWMFAAAFSSSIRVCVEKALNTVIGEIDPDYPEEWEFRGGDGINSGAYAAIPSAYRLLAVSCEQVSMLVSQGPCSQPLMVPRGHLCCPLCSVWCSL